MSKVTPELEKVARAIHQREYETPMSQVSARWEGEPNKGYWINLARAALQAIREPTERMVEASGATTDLTADKFSHAFTRAIDAALGEDKG